MQLVMLADRCTDRTVELKARNAARSSPMVPTAHGPAAGRAQRRQLPPLKSGHAKAAPCSCSRVRQRRGSQLATAAAMGASPASSAGGGGWLAEPLAARPPAAPSPSLYSPDLAPVPEEQRTFGTFDMAALWVGLVVSVSSWFLAGKTASRQPAPAWQRRLDPLRGPALPPLAPLPQEAWWNWDSVPRRASSASLQVGRRGSWQLGRLRGQGPGGAGCTGCSLPPTPCTLLHAPSPHPTPTTSATHLPRQPTPLCWCPW